MTTHERNRIKPHCPSPLHPGNRGWGDWDGINICDECDRSEIQIRELAVDALNGNKPVKDGYTEMQTHTGVTKRRRVYATLFECLDAITLNGPEYVFTYSDSDNPPERNAIYEHRNEWRSMLADAGFAVHSDFWDKVADHFADQDDNGFWQGCYRKWVNNPRKPDRTQYEKVHDLIEYLIGVAQAD